jgi:two-component system LytT family response regulator
MIDHAHNGYICLSMKVLITDDEAETRKSVRKLIELYCPEVTEIREATGVQDGLKCIAEFRPDVVVSDVEMGDGTGMDMISSVKQQDFELIFITAYNKYAVNAFQLSAIDFLLKPVEPDLLIESFHRAATNMKIKKQAAQINVLQEYFGNQNSERKRIVLREQDMVHVVQVKDILYCAADKVYTTFFIRGGKQVIVSRNLKEYEDSLADYNFSRIHHSYLVNMNALVQFDKTEGGFVILEEGHRIPVSQRKRDQVTDYLRNI